MWNISEKNEDRVFILLATFTVVMLILGGWYAYSTIEFKKSLVETVKAFPETEYRVIEYSKLEGSGLENGSMDIISNDDVELFNTEIKYINEKGELQILSNRQSVIVKYIEGIHEPKLVIKKVPTEKQNYKISDCVNPTLILPLEK
ncbi:hypothetical protein CN895_07600 [Bacillus cereus]|uniref:hypothetical protein n=1 Tax=Bacillus cereus TaxID=1396 RepID=UPI000BFC5748|nr:hypothetical protein [Bacillus cereus]PGK15205.1 hypothetical protein CN895_07600 [Bacillus cereus]